jgi:hypothetical protein
MDTLRATMLEGTNVSSAVTRSLHQKGSPNAGQVCMACHQPVAAPGTRTLSDEGMNQSKGYNVATRVNRQQQMAGAGPHETDPRLLQVPGGKRGVLSPSPSGGQKVDLVPHLIKEDLAEWEYEVDGKRASHEKEGGGSRFPPIEQRPLQGRGQ